MPDRSVGQQYRADIGDAAEHVFRPERRVELVEMNETIEQRQDRGVGADDGTDRLDRRVEVVMLGGQQHEVVGPADPVGGRDLDRHLEIAEGALYLEPALVQRGGARAAHEEGDVLPGLGEAAAEIAAHRAGSEHEYAHRCLLSRWSAGSCRYGRSIPSAGALRRP